MNKRTINTILVSALIFSINFNSYSQESTEKVEKKVVGAPQAEQSSVTPDKILLKLENIDSNSMEDFVLKMGEVNKLSNEYINYKQQVCSGEYSSLIINDDGEREVLKKRLSKKERKLCMYLLVNFRIQYTKAAYRIRKSHLRKLHARQMVELETVEKKKVGELEVLAQKFK